MTLPIDYVDLARISGAALRAQRLAAGISSQEALSREIYKRTGLLVAQQRISDWERSFKFECDKRIALAIRAIVTESI
jgi:hypothetical protein